MYTKVCDPNRLIPSPRSKALLKCFVVLKVPGNYKKSGNRDVAFKELGKGREAFSYEFVRTKSTLIKTMLSIEQAPPPKPKPKPKSKFR